MATTNFQIGNSFLYAAQGYIWTITAITGNWISMECKNHTIGCVIKAGMKEKDLKAIVKERYTQIK